MRYTHHAPQQLPEFHVRTTACHYKYVVNHEAYRQTYGLNNNFFVILKRISMVYAVLYFFQNHAFEVVSFFYPID